MSDNKCHFIYLNKLNLKSNIYQYYNENSVYITPKIQLKVTIILNTY